MTKLIADPSNLVIHLAACVPGDIIQLRNGTYVGEFDLKTPGITLEPYPDHHPVFTGPPAFVAGAKPGWFHVWATAKGTILRKLSFVREGDIALIWKVGWNDYGIIVEAPDVRIEACVLSGMAKGIHVKGSTSTNGTIKGCSIGPTIDSGIAIASSKSVVRRLLITENDISGSYREDGIQFMPDYEIPVADQEKDISNLGAIIVANDIHHCNENAIDLKGAGLFVIEDNMFYAIAGSSNGAPDWNHKSNGVIIRGARTSTGPGIIRNNDCRDNCSGFWMFAGWRIYHNTIQTNNWSPWDSWQGIGVSQRGTLERAALINNLVSGHKNTDLQLTQASINMNNPTQPGPGLALTHTRGAGKGRLLTVDDASLFTDWFGRKDLPLDVIYLGQSRFEIQDIDRTTNTLKLDKDAEWQDGDRVCWRSPTPQVGAMALFEPPPIEPVEPPTEPPPTVTPPVEPAHPIVTPPEAPTAPEMVQLTMTFTVPAARVEEMQRVLDSMTVTLTEQGAGDIAIVREQA